MRTVLEGRLLAREEGKRKTKGNVTELVTGNKRRVHRLSTFPKNMVQKKRETETMKTKTKPAHKQQNKTKEEDHCRRVSGKNVSEKNNQ